MADIPINNGCNLAIFNFISLSNELITAEFPWILKFENMKLWLMFLWGKLYLA